MNFEHQEDNHTELLYQTRSDDAQEIMGRRLPWMAKWGILLVCLLFAILFVILSSFETKEGTVFHVLFQSGK